MTNDRILQLVEKQKDYVINCRRTIHRFAEVSGTEEKTSAFIQGEIEALGLPWEKVSKTGLMAVLETEKPGPHIALRADIDALPIPEEPNNLNGPRVCISDNPATSHACGHDAHSAMLLGVMKVMAENREEVSGTIYFCFEEGEENGGGIFQMLEALKKRQVDAVWAIHVYADLPSGKICVSPGPRMSGAAGIGIQLTGKGGHSSRPDLAVNPVVCAASMVTELASAWVNQITVGETVTLGIGSIQGGTVGNVIPDTATILGSMRFFNPQEGKKALELVKNVARHTASIHRCQVEFLPRCQILADPVINDGKLAAIAQKGLKEILGEEAVCDCPPWYASESFHLYGKAYPSVMAHLGIQNPEYGSGAAHHNGLFDVDENVLPAGMAATLKFAAELAEAFQEEGGGGYQNNETDNR